MANSVRLNLCFSAVDNNNNIVVPVVKTVGLDGVTRHALGVTVCFGPYVRLNRKFNLLWRETTFFRATSYIFWLSGLCGDYGPLPWTQSASSQWTSLTVHDVLFYHRWGHPSRQGDVLQVLFRIGPWTYRGWTFWDCQNFKPVAETALLAQMSYGNFLSRGITQWPVAELF